MWYLLTKTLPWIITDDTSCLEVNQRVKKKYFVLQNELSCHDVNLKLKKKNKVVSIILIDLNLIVQQPNYGGFFFFFFF